MSLGVNTFSQLIPATLQIAYISLVTLLDNLKMDFLKITDETETGFEKIAGDLFNHFAIETANGTYRLTEIEFYWHSPSHPDKSTYERKHVDPQAGEWFFHYSGVDIALKNNETGGYGGILIRGIYNIESKKLYKGPMVCAMRLFSGTNAFSSFIKTQVVKHDFTAAGLNKTPRINLGQNAVTSGTDKCNYRFYIDLK